MDEDQPISGVVYLPRWFRTLGLWGGGVCLAFSMGFGWFSPGFGLFWAVLALGFGGLYLARRNWCVVYDEDSIETVNALGLCRRIHHEEVCGIRGKHLYLRQQGRNRVLTLPMGAVGRMDFLNTVQKKYRIVHHGKALPLVRPKKRWDIFRGNVDCGGAPYAIYGVVLMLFVLLLWVGMDGAHHVYTPDNTAPVELTLTRHWVSGDNLYLEAQGYDARFVLQDYEDMTPEGRRAVASWGAGTVLQAHISTSGRPNSRAYHYVIHHLTDPQGVELFTFQQDTARNQAKWQVFLICLGVLFLLWSGFCGFVVYVGRHPEHFNPRTVYRLFGKGNIYWKGYFKDGTN